MRHYIAFVQTFVLSFTRTGNKSLVDRELILAYTR